MLKYEICVIKDGRVLLFIKERTKKQAKKQLKKFSKEFPDCDVQLYYRENKEAA